MSRRSESLHSARFLMCCDEELDLELPATQVTGRNWAAEQCPPQVGLFAAPFEQHDLGP